LHLCRLPSPLALRQ